MQNRLVYYERFKLVIWDAVFLAMTIVLGDKFYYNGFMDKF